MNHYTTQPTSQPTDPRHKAIALIIREALHLVGIPHSRLTFSQREIKGHILCAFLVPCTTGSLATIAALIEGAFLGDVQLIAVEYNPGDVEYTVGLSVNVRAAVQQEKLL